jgi:thioredoxin reductase
MTNNPESPRPDPTDAQESTPPDHAYDVAVVGGGAAGLSAAVALARFGQSVVVIDEGTPRNAAAGHIHNLLSRDGTSPAELYRIGRSEVTRFGGHVIAGTVRSASGSAGAFTLQLEDRTLQLEDRTLSAHRIIAATGSRDELPDVPGLAERWGKDVVHCGFCHGYEVRDQRVGVLATTPMAVHQAMMFRLLSPHVTVLAHSAPPTPEQSDVLAQRGIGIAPGMVAEVLTRHDHLTGVRLADGSHVELDALVVASVVHARADFLAPLGLRPTEFSANGHVFGTRIETGANGATDVPGVWVAGNTSEPMAQVVAAAANGLAVASAIIAERVSAAPVQR